jgi:hypothetical protein
MKTTLACQDNRKSPLAAGAISCLAAIYIFKKYLTNSGLSNNITPLFHNASALSAFLF